MKRIMLLGMLVFINQFVFAQTNVSDPKPKKIQGCVYGDVIYKVGAKHRVQTAVTDPDTHKTMMVDLEPEIVQECMEDENADKTKSPRFYWRTLPNKH